MARLWHVIGPSFAIAVLASSLAQMAGAGDAPPPQVQAVTHKDGLRTGLGREELQDAATTYYANNPPQGPFYNYTSTSYCTTQPPGQSEGLECGPAWKMCEGVPVDALDLRGEAVWVWRLRVDAAGRPADANGVAIDPAPAAPAWERIGFTCMPGLIPGAAPRLTMAMIVKQFHDTAFAVGQAGVQPVGGTTLVNLPTYYALTFPVEGFEPNEIDTATLLGHRVEIRPVFDSANYVYGDGQESGPTTSLGGPYPSGDVVHIYRQALTAQVRVDVTYRGQFQVDGSGWVDIPSTVTITGRVQDLRVAEARARLYNE